MNTIKTFLTTLHLRSINETLTYTKADLDLLKKGSVTWNKWREENPRIIPDLTNVNLRGINLFDVNLKNSNLQGTNLTEVENLASAQLGGSNLGGAKVPRESLNFDGIAQVESAIKYTQRVFVMMVLGCLYTWITVATTSDANLITNSSFSPLPIIGSKIQIGGFYFVAPILLVCVYFYLHIYLQRLWERLSPLPAVFPDGQSIDQKINPWFPTGLVYRYFLLLKPRTPPLAWLQTWISIFITWLLVPVFTLPVLWLAYFPQHFWPTTTVQALLILIACGFGLHSYVLASRTLQNKEFSGLTHLHWLGVILIAIILSILSFGGFTAVQQRFAIMPEKQPGQWSNEILPNQFPSINWFQRLVLWTFGTFGYSPFPNLEGAEVSIKPSNWSGDNLYAVIGARLDRRYLRYMNAPRAFLVNADLREANLESANLVEADLRFAKLGGSKLSNAYLMKSDLQNSSLWGTDLRHAYLLEAKLRNAALFKAEGEKAFLQGADLQDANLHKANFQCANFNRANMAWAELYDYKWGTTESHVSLIQLEGANFAGADLTLTRLEGAQLLNVRGLTQGQLDRACVNERTLLPVGFSRPAPCPTPAERFFVPHAERKTRYSYLTVGSLQVKLNVSSVCLVVSSNGLNYNLIRSQRPTQRKRIWIADK
jgi:uncharacterized protein YjbI with pentapeptide repeats